MYQLAICAQIIIALSIVFVWVFRFPNIVKEFEQYHLSELTRSAVGAAKIALSTLLIAGIWYPRLVVVPALLMAFLMLCAQAAHFKVHNPWQKHMPSLGLLLLSLFVAGVYSGVLPR
ncbi:MAG TPA: DoxX family protein [Acidobacteriaceae bacterium]